MNDGKVKALCVPQRFFILHVVMMTKRCEEQNRFNCYAPGGRCCVVKGRDTNAAWTLQEGREQYKEMRVTNTTES